jgi:hypothetical protein
MSLTLLTTTRLGRLRGRARTRPGTNLPSAVKPERPAERRARLRAAVLACGGRPMDIETIVGDRPAQTARQIQDLTDWLARQPAGDDPPPLAA